MTPDQPRSTAHTLNTPNGRGAEQLPLVLVVDPDTLGRVAHQLGELPGPHNPALAPPPAEAIGDAKLADQIEAFGRRYRAAALALAEDNDTLAAHLGNAAAAYRGTEARVAAILTELAAELRPAQPHPNDPNDTDPDDTNRDDTDPDDADDTEQSSTDRYRTDRQI